MMPIGSKKKAGMGHQFEAVADSGNLVVAQTGNHAGDGGRLLPLVELAQAADPAPVTQVTADTGYFHGAQIIGLQEKGLEVIVPDKETARKLHGRAAPEKVPLVFIPVEGRNAYRCPEGKLLKLVGYVTKHDQRFTKYKAEEDCRECPRAKECLNQPTAKRRNLLIGEFRDQLKTYIERFRDPEVRKAYDGRGPAIETVFAVIRSVLGFERWHVRGKDAVSAEGALIASAYQIKKIQLHLKKTGQTFAGVMA
jgi:hypothetical protein